LKSEGWGSALVQKKYQEEKVCDSDIVTLDTLVTQKLLIRSEYYGRAKNVATSDKIGTLVRCNKPAR
jgi:hypothetical protein